jgi:hypothetical protein
MSTGHPGTRDAALRAIGRNLVNFQKLEHCLKALVRPESLAGPMSTLNGKAATRVAKTSQYTLGRAVQEWLRVATPEQTARPQTQDLFEPWISVSLELPIDSEALASHSSALEALASERNELVHHKLARLNFDSEAECKDLVAVLDRQNERILEQLAFLSPAIKLLLELKRIATNPQSLEQMLTIVEEVPGDKWGE